MYVRVAVFYVKALGLMLLGLIWFSAGLQSEVTSLGYTTNCPMKTVNAVWKFVPRSAPLWCGKWLANGVAGSVSSPAGR